MTETSFLHMGGAGLPHRDRVRSSALQEELLLLRIEKRSDEVARAPSSDSGQDRKLVVAFS